MIKRASDGMVLTYGKGLQDKDGKTVAAQITGPALTEYMSRLNDYLTLFEKVAKRLRNDDVTLAFIQLFAHEGASPAKREDFLSPRQALRPARPSRSHAPRAPVPRPRRPPSAMKSTRPGPSASPTPRAPSARSTGRIANAAESRQLLGKYALASSPTSCKHPSSSPTLPRPGRRSFPGSHGRGR